MKRLFTLIALVFASSACGSDGSSSSFESGSTGSFLVVNDSSQDLYFLYVSPSSSSSWGPDQLGTEILDPGESIEINGVPCGRDYDLKAELDYDTATEWDVYLPCGATVRWTLY